MSWHDNYVHGLRLVEGEHGSGELLLDLDYILEWLPAPGDPTAYHFRIAPVQLRFLGVTDLSIALDFAAVSAAMGPFSIDGIERREEERQRYRAVCWRIPVNFPSGVISFEATGFEQDLAGKELVTDRQWLTASERGRRP